MATIRRVLIAIVGLLLMVDAAALAYVKFTSGPAPSDEKSKLVMWVDKGEQAKTAVAFLKEQNYDPIVKPDKRKTEVEADFRVAMKSTKKELLKPIEQILRQSGHQQLSYSEDGTKLYYGGFYKQKSEAVRMAERIKSKEQLVFEVVPGVKTVGKASNKVILMSVSTNMVETVMSDLAAKGVEINDFVETSLEPKPEEPKEEASSEEEE
jgi:hypothetical protein